MSIICKEYCNTLYGVTVGDKIYCWNSKTKKVDVYTCKANISIKKCPESVIKALINKDYDVEIIFNEKEKQE